MKLIIYYLVPARPIQMVKVLIIAYVQELAEKFVQQHLWLSNRPNILL